jgi:DHA2 family methylenomycin A resistance protein-like MFS transporter
VQPRFFAHRGFAAATLGVSAGNLGSYTVMLAVPILLARQSGWSSTGIGLVLALQSAPMVVAAFAGGQLADRLGRRIPTVTGHAMLALGIAPLALNPALPPLALVACLALAGAGLGLGSAGLQTSAVESVSAAHAGVASGLFSTCRYIGSFAGSVVLARLLSGQEGLDGFAALFAVAFFGSVLAIAASLALPAHPPKRDELRNT